MKSIEIPVSQFILIMVVIFLVIVSLLFLFGSQETVSPGSVKKEICSQLIEIGCDTDPSSIPVNAFGLNNLQEFCEVYYGCPEGDKDCCRDICGC